MSVLITGGGGFIGFEIAKALKKGGNDVVILDNNPNLKNWIEAEKLDITRAYSNVLNINIIPELIEMGKTLDVIIHCAAQTAVTRSLDDPRNDFKNNAMGTFEVCEYARKNDLQIIYTSTNKVYGENVNKVSRIEKDTRYEFGGGFTIDETFPIDLTSHSPYGCSKLAGDIYVQDYNYTYGLITDVFRMSCIYGATQNGTEDQGWVNHIAKRIAYDDTVKIFGNGKQVRDILYVDDLVKLFKLAIENYSSGVFNVGGGRENTISVIELINLLNPNHKKIEYYDWREADQKVYISNTAKVKKVFGWSPEISPEVGIKRMYDKIIEEKF